MITGIITNIHDPHGMAMPVLLNKVAEQIQYPFLPIVFFRPHSNQCVGFAASAYSDFAWGTTHFQDFFDTR
jgi:hypothetical protein